MEFNTPASLNATDRQRVVGHPLDRVDVRLQVTGRAPYAYEHSEGLEAVAYGTVVGRRSGRAP